MFESRCTSELHNELGLLLFMKLISRDEFTRMFTWSSAIDWL